MEELHTQLRVKRFVEGEATKGEARYEFFQLRYDARGRRGFTTLQKCVVAIHLMAMGESPDTMDDSMGMSERTARESMYTLSRDVAETFGDMYLRKTSLHDFQELYAAHKERHDRIYPQYSTFVKSFRHQVEERDKDFKRRQEGRAFVVLKAKWHIVEHAARPLDLETLRYIMYACIIMHNMVVEDKGRNIAHYIPTELRHVQFQPGTTEYLHQVVDIQDANKHRKLREDLADYIFYV
ncbi:uncharacterized protein LOC111902309 [Lactuca sativa]|uniref:uncharacterized protein LOC111902309 n=1 Tax=Lactuca sativa TaxID=4236 RepID=UPI0022AF2810|nr:uncharacterized protein LOC111902309 [Lactuca sativa]